MNLTVIKLGGSLMRSTELSYWLENIESVSLHSNVVIVPGGGEFADLVRNTQKERQFDDYVAHQMALLAMCQYGYLLNGMNKKLRIIEDMALFPSYFGKNLPLLWIPMSLINNDSDIAANWDFTSDSISLWLATKLCATRLVLVKSKVLNKTTTRNHIKNGDLDKGFQELSSSYSGEILFFEKKQYEQFHEFNFND